MGKGQLRRAWPQPTDEELFAYAATWTESRLKGLEESAENALAQFASTVVDENAPSIREDALRGSLPRAVGASMLAAFLYTLLLIGAVAILRRAGIDVLSIASSVGAAPTTNSTLPGKTSAGQ